MPGRYLPPDLSQGDESTVGGYMAVHARPAAFEGRDGMSYSVEILADEMGDAEGRWGGYLLFLRWRRYGEAAVEGHLESDFLAQAASEQEARAAVGRLSLREAKDVLDALVRRDYGGAPQRRWWDVMRADEDGEERGIVLEGTGGVWRVRVESGVVREVSLRGRLKKSDGGRRSDGSRRRNTIRAGLEAVKLAVGDEVLLEEGERGGAWAISEILPRRSRLARRSPGGGFGERVVIANLDQVVVVFAAAEPEPHPRMVDRFLVIAEGNGLAARLVVNKVELVGEEVARARFGLYEAAGYPVHYVSAAARTGLDELHVALRGRVSALTGPSGVGKSSLINALYPGLDLRVGEISMSVGKGRHTTVGALLTPLPDGGFVGDTPGLREVGLWGLPAAGVDRLFPEMRPLLGGCRFADCAHRHEPGCAVREAVAEDDVATATRPVTRARYDSYLKLRDELEAVERAWP